MFSTYALFLLRGSARGPTLELDSIHQDPESDMSCFGNSSSQVRFDESTVVRMLGNTEWLP